MNHMPDMTEKTLRYSGHLDLIIALKESGFFDSFPFQINGADINPLEFTSKLLLKDWKLGHEEEEFSIMKGEHNTIEYDLLDRYDRVTKTSSMARTTGYTCAAVVHLIANGMFISKGVFPPELVGGNKECFDFVMEYLTERNVSWKMTVC
jgi:saccharopine dehydrogenase-like NADP-dependent oxidoreductase